MVNFEKLPGEGQVRLNPKEVNDIVKKFNNPRLSADNPEYFVIDGDDCKKFVPKRTHVPFVSASGKVSQIKISDYLRDVLENIGSEQEKDQE